MRLNSRAAYKARDERLMELLAEGKSLESITALLGLKNVQVTRVKICKIKRKAREALLATPDDALSVVPTPAK